MATRTKTPSVRAFDTPDLDRAIAEAEDGAIIVWRGEHLPFGAVPERIARTDDRHERDRLYGAYLDALEALNPLYEDRLERWRQAGDVTAATAGEGIDPGDLAVDLERFVMHSETPYYAALRRYLALIDIEQGDATVADVWHVARGTGWAHWFGDREVRRAVLGAGRAIAEAERIEGWSAAETALAGGNEPMAPETVAASAANAAYATLVGSPDWLAQELGLAAAEVVPFADFAAYVRLWRLRRDIGQLQYELRLFRAPIEPAVARAYYAGIVGHMTGVAVSEAAYLRAIPRPFASVRELQSAILAAGLVDVLEHRHGPTWWRDPASADLVRSFADAPSVDAALAQLGYDALDWRPVLRQIRTRLIGEMSGYGGPNITTRAGTRKV